MRAAGCGKQLCISVPQKEKRRPPLQSALGTPTTPRGTTDEHCQTATTAPPPCLATVQHSLGNVAASKKQHQGHSHKRAGVEHGSLLKSATKPRESAETEWEPRGEEGR